MRQFLASHGPNNGSESVFRAAFAPMTNAQANVTMPIRLRRSNPTLRAAAVDPMTALRNGN